jgi:hypothetical protein
MVATNGYSQAQMAGTSSCNTPNAGALRRVSLVLNQPRKPRVHRLAELMLYSDRVVSVTSDGGYSGVAAKEYGDGTISEDYKERKSGRCSTYTQGRGGVRLVEEFLGAAHRDYASYDAKGFC